MSAEQLEAGGRVFGEWQGRVTQALEHLKDSVEKIESEGSTRREYKDMAEKVTSIQKTLMDMPNAIIKAVKDASEAAEKNFDNRLQDLGILTLRTEVQKNSQDVATLTEATETLKATALRYGLLGGVGTGSVGAVIGLIYWLVTGETPAH